SRDAPKTVTSGRVTSQPLTVSLSRSGRSCTFRIKACTMREQSCAYLVVVLRSRFNFFAVASYAGTKAQFIDRFQIDPPAAADLESRKFILLNQPVNRRGMHPQIAGDLRECEYGHFRGLFRPAGLCP